VRSASVPAATAAADAELAAIINASAKRGLAALRERGLDARAAADVLASLPGLQKRPVGELLGLRDDTGYAGQLLVAFAARENFSGLEIDEALRTFLQLFWLPGESQVWGEVCLVCVRELTGATDDRANYARVFSPLQRVQPGHL
jgi:hypothetical protein